MLFLSRKIDFQVWKSNSGPKNRFPDVKNLFSRLKNRFFDHQIESYPQNGFFDLKIQLSVQVIDFQALKVVHFLASQIDFWPQIRFLPSNSFFGLKFVFLPKIQFYDLKIDSMVRDQFLDLKNLFFDPKNQFTDLKIDFLA